MSKQVSISKDDLKKVVLILKSSKKYVKVSPTDLTTANLWRVSSKLADRLLKAANMVCEETPKGKLIVKELQTMEEKKHLCRKRKSKQQ